MSTRRYVKRGGKAYDPDRDKCLKKLGEFDVGENTYKFTIQQYTGFKDRKPFKYPPKLCIFLAYFSRKSGDVRWQRLNGIPVDAADIMLQEDLIEEYLTFVEASEKIVPLAATRTA